MTERIRTERADSSFVSVLVPLMFPVLWTLATDLHLPDDAKISELVTESEGNYRVGFFDLATSILHVPTGATVRAFVDGVRILVHDYKRKKDSTHEPRGYIEVSGWGSATLTSSHPEEELGDTGILAVYQPQEG